MLPSIAANSISRWLQKQWQKKTLWQLVLLPVSLVFSCLIWLRQKLYATGFIKSDSLAVPVIVIGNVTVGGTGKTPLVIWMAQWLKSEGYSPGIISRGYGGKNQGPTAVFETSDPLEVGDEPLLVARRTLCPVWIGKNRVDVARHLLNKFPECDVIISDDGLQHYRLRRDIEISVVDEVLGFGNGRMLPAGPLREPLSRLATVDAIVANGSGMTPEMIGMSLESVLVYELGHPENIVSIEYFRGREIHAVAGIGNPNRFFQHLQKAGLRVVMHPFPDHHVFNLHELDFGDQTTIMMTEKDAVKCEKLPLRNAWVLTVEAKVESKLTKIVLERLRKAHEYKAS